MDPSQPIIIDDGDLNDLLYQPSSAWQHKQGENYHGSTYSNGFTNGQVEFKFNGMSCLP